MHFKSILARKNFISIKVYFLVLYDFQVFSKNQILK